MLGAVSIGIVFGHVSVGRRCQRDCGADYSAMRETIGAVAFGIGVGAGAGALVGLLADHLVKGRQIVYPVASTTSTWWQIRPAIADKGLRVHAIVRWERALRTTNGATARNRSVATHRPERHGFPATTTRLGTADL